ncbi:MAG: YlbF family regulator [Solirubrobacterales bacterium]
MNVYDKAHETARALKESQQGKKYETAREALKKNEENWQVLQDFRVRQSELQAKILEGEPVPGEKMDELNRLFLILTQNPVIMEYLQAELELITVIEDIQQILLKAVELGKPAQE